MYSVLWEYRGQIEMTLFTGLLFLQVKGRLALPFAVLPVPKIMYRRRPHRRPRYHCHRVRPRYRPHRRSRQNRPGA